MHQLYLLFEDFNFDFQGTDLPLDLGDGVWLESADEIQTVLHAHPETMAVTVPYQCAGLGQVHVCLRTPFERDGDYGLALTKLWWSLIRLRLYAPFRYVTSGYVGTLGSKVTHFNNYYFTPIVSPRDAPKVDAEAARNAREIAKSVARWKGRNFNRPRSGLIFFAQSSLGLVNSWQLAVLGLTACLDAFFPHPDSQKIANKIKVDERYAPRLARRVASFVGAGVGLKGTERWVASFYKEKRNSLAHGVWVAPERVSRRISNAADLLRLHETARIVILGMLGLPPKTIRTALPVHAGALSTQHLIETTLTQAGTTHLAGQHAFSDLT